MEEFLNEVMGNTILITVNDGDFSLTTEGKVENIRDNYFIVGANSFSMTFSNICSFNKEEEFWFIKTNKNLDIIVSILDKIR